MRWIRAGAAGLALLAAGCGQDVVRGSGQVVERDLDVGGFDRIEVASALDVTVVAADEAGATVRGDDNVVDRVEADVRRDTLRLSLEDEVSLTGAELAIEVRVPELVGLRVSGASSVTLEPAVPAEELSVELSGAASLDGQVSVDALTATLAGASDLTLEGGADRATVEADGASELDLADLTVGELEVSLSGASSGEVTVTDTLAVELAGASSLVYAGSPEVTDQDVTQASSLAPAD